jgi:cyclase
MAPCCPADRSRWRWARSTTTTRTWPIWPGPASGLASARSTPRGLATRYTAWPDTERIVLNLHRAYADLDAPGFSFDSTAAFGDAMTFAGGPLPCSA